MKLFKSKSGFTLIELLVVIGILAVLAAIAIPSVAGLIDRANVSADKTNANEMTNAMERFATEYELYCQDIASGVITADTTNFDAAQGRVYNVTGALSRSDIENLEVAQGATVADDQIAIYRDTKYPVNAITAKSVVMNYTKTSSSTFEPKQSDMHFWYSPDCGVVVFAEPNADVVTQLNVQILSGKDAKGNELGASTKWIDLTADTTAVATHAMLNKTDVLDGYNTAYFRSAGDFDNFVAVKIDGNVVDGSNYTLSEGSTVVVLKPEYVQTLADGEHTMEIASTDGIASCSFEVLLGTGSEFKYKNIKYGGGSMMYVEVLDDNSISYGDILQGEIARIPAACVTTTKTSIIVSGTGTFDGVWTLQNDGEVFANDYSYFVRLDACKHYTMWDNSSVWHNFYRGTERINLGDITKIEELQGCKLFCDLCGEEMPVYVDIENGYLYFKNTSAEPQRLNGERIEYYSPDMCGEKINMWYAIFYDGAKTKEVLSSISGQAVEFAYVSNGTILPKTIKYIYMLSDCFATDTVEITYDGTKSDFAKVKGSYWVAEQRPNWTAINEIEQNLQYGWGSGENTFVVHCTDGDLTYSNH